jgi:aminoglycoside/choline kinase family phosphotransferase
MQESKVLEITAGAKELFQEYFSLSVERTEEVCSHASARVLVRVSGGGRSAVVAYNPCAKEDSAFVALTECFRRVELPVPQIYVRDSERHLIMMQDLGPTTLLDIVNQEGVFSNRVKDLYKKALEYLAQFQLSAGAVLDYSACYPRREFDVSGMRYDIQAFRNEFLRRHLLENSVALEEVEFTEWLDSNPLRGFMYRDFQSRNIMVDGQDRLWFIDYQSGRSGPLQYDVISLLFQSRAKLPHELRQELLRYYLDLLQEKYAVDSSVFLEYFDGLIVLRMMQVLATYGRLGLSAGNPLFVKSIPMALKTLGETCESSETLQRCFPKLIETCSRLVEDGKECYA